jgi:hypothetical protein
MLNDTVFVAAKSMQIVMLDDQPMDAPELSLVTFHRHSSGAYMWQKKDLCVFLVVFSVKISNQMFPFNNTMLLRCKVSFFLVVEL